MVDSPTPRHTPHNMNPFLLYITAVNLLKGVLISANNNGRLIDIEEQVVVGLAKVSQGKLFQCQIDLWFSNTFIVNKYHGMDRFCNSEECKPPLCRPLKFKNPS